MYVCIISLFFMGNWLIKLEMWVSLLKAMSLCMMMELKFMARIFGKGRSQAGCT